MNLPVKELWAYLAVDPDDGDEGIVAAWVSGSWTPLVGADRQRMESLRELATAYAHDAGRLFRLVRFDQRTDVETIDGRGEGTGGT